MPDALTEVREALEFGRRSIVGEFGPAAGEKYDRALARLKEVEDVLQKALTFGDHDPRCPGAAGPTVTQVCCCYLADIARLRGGGR